jgi:hypothetical protein
MLVRMNPPNQVAYQTRVVNGRTYTGVPGTFLDVPDFDADQLEANGWQRLYTVGPTTARPAGAIGLYPATPGVKFYDSTLSQLLEFDGAAWRDALTGAAV